MNFYFHISTSNLKELNGCCYFLFIERGMTVFKECVFKMKKEKTKENTINLLTKQRVLYCESLVS